MPSSYLFTPPVRPLDKSYFHSLLVCYDPSFRYDRPPTPEQYAVIGEVCVQFAGPATALLVLLGSPAGPQTFLAQILAESALDEDRAFFIGRGYLTACLRREDKISIADSIRLQEGVEVPGL